MQTAVSEVPARRLPLYGLLTAILVSTIGNTVAALAIPWYVLTTTGSPARTGVVALANTIPLVIGAFFGGAIVDRLGFRRSGVLADVASGVSVAAIPLLDMTVGLPFWALLVLVFLGAAFDTAGVTARTALLVDLAKMARMRLEQVTSMEEMALNVPLLIGPPLAGALIAVLDPTRLLWLDAASFAFSATVTIALVPRGAGRREEESDGVLTELVEGVRFVTRDRPLLWLIAFTGIITVLVAPLPSVILPVYMQATYGSALSLGLLIAAFGIGALVGVVVHGIAGHLIPRKVFLVVGAGGLAAVGAVFSAMPPLEVILVTAGLGGAAYGPWSPLLTTVASERVPEDVRGRVFGILTAVSVIAVPVGVLVVGLSLEMVGVRPFMMMIAFALATVAVAVGITPEIRKLNRLPGEMVQDSSKS